jgi:hypothetical protein
VSLTAARLDDVCRVIRYHGWPIALAGTDEVNFHPALLDLAALEEGHALVRFASALALRAFQVATGLEQGPFDQGRAERFARTLLMPAAELIALVEESDAALAEWFGGAGRAGPAAAGRAPLAGPWAGAAP